MHDGCILMFPVNVKGSGATFVSLTAYTIHPKINVAYYSFITSYVHESLFRHQPTGFAVVAAVENIHKKSLELGRSNISAYTAVCIFLI